MSTVWCQNCAKDSNKGDYIRLQNHPSWKNDVWYCNEECKKKDLELYENSVIIKDPDNLTGKELKAFADLCNGRKNKSRIDPRKMSREERKAFKKEKKRKAKLKKNENT